MTPATKYYIAAVLIARVGGVLIAQDILLGTTRPLLQFGQATLNGKEQLVIDNAQLLAEEGLHLAVGLFDLPGVVPLGRNSFRLRPNSQRPIYAIRESMRR
jgi:hypothetical protein